MADQKISQLGLQAEDPDDFFVISRNGKLFKIKKSNIFLGASSAGVQFRFYTHVNPSTTRGDFAVVSTDPFQMNIFFPVDMSNILEVLLIYIADSNTANPSYDINISFFKEGETVITDQTTNFTPPAESNNTMINLDITSAFSGVAGGDVVGVEVDEIVGSSLLIGIQVKHD